MAPFNPNTKDVNPVNPIGWSKAAEVPSSFASGLSESIKGIGNVLGLGAKAGDELVQDSAKKETLASIEPIRDDYISQLAGMDFQNKLGVVDTANTSITQGSVDDVPKDLKKEIGGLSVLSDARANGKVSESNYYARLMTAASDLRSRYPVGYRDYIDKEISKITGVDPANAYLHSLIGDINANLTNKQAERTKALSVVQEVLGLDPTGASEVWRKISNGQMSPDQGIAYAAPFLAIKATHDATMARIAEQKAGIEANKTNVAFSFGKFAAQTANEQLNSAIKLKVGDDPQKINDVIQNSLTGRTKLSSEEAMAYGDQVLAMKQAYLKAMQDQMYAQSKDKPSVYSQLLDDGHKIINENAKVFDEMADYFYNGKTGLAFQSKRMFDGINNDVAARLYKQDPTTAVILGTTKVIREVGGDNMISRWQQHIINKELDTVMDTFLKKVVADIATPERSGVIKEARTGAEAVRAGIKAQEIYKSTLPTYFEGIKQLVDGEKMSLLDPETPTAMKDEIAFNLFNEKNIGMLRLIKTDIRDPKTGQMLPGQEAWFNRWTAPDVVKEMANRKPGVQKMYRDWVSQTYEELFGKAISDLGSMNISGAYNVGWNNVTNQLEVNTNRPDTDSTKGYGIARNALRVNPVQDVVDRVNKGIQGLTDYYRGQNLANEDIEARVLGSLRFRLDDRNNASPRVNNLPERFLRSMALNYELKKAEEEAKAAKKKETDKAYSK